MMDERDRRLAAMMWLELALEPDYCKLVAGVDQLDASWIAHELLAGPIAPQWEWAVEHTARVRANSVIEGAQYTARMSDKGRDK